MGSGNSKAVIAIAIIDWSVTNTHTTKYVVKSICLCLDVCSLTILKRDLYMKLKKDNQANEEHNSTTQFNKEILTVS